MVDLSGLGGSRPLTEATLRTRLLQLGLMSSSDAATSVATKEYVDSAASDLPQGELDYAEITSNVNVGSTDQDIAGLSSTVSLPAGRIIKITAQAPITCDATERAILSIEEVAGDGASGRFLDHEGQTTTHRYTGSGSLRLTPSAGEHTYVVHYNVVSGSAHVVEAASSAAFIMVEDLGAA